MRRRAGSLAMGPSMLSFDVDAIDPAFAPGTGTPEIGGFSTADSRPGRSRPGRRRRGGGVAAFRPERDDRARRGNPHVRNRLRAGRCGQPRDTLAPPRSGSTQAGVPGFMAYGGLTPLYIVQTRKVVWLIFSGDHQVRRVYMEVPHLVCRDSSRQNAGTNPAWRAPPAHSAVG